MTLQLATHTSLHTKGGCDKNLLECLTRRFDPPHTVSHHATVKEEKQKVASERTSTALAKGGWGELVIPDGTRTKGARLRSSTRNTSPLAYQN